MRFLVDECTDFMIVRRLREAGHDVLAIAEQEPGLSDLEVLGRAKAEQRVLVTEDKGFGQLSFLGQHGSAGIILVRRSDRHRLAEGLLRVVEEQGERLHHLFVVMDDRGVRLRPL